ncbi:MAG: hypothetical protein SVV80_08950 [Planctomycetota bacterium]|nr:hypothetical protein [Planctomycetota bacterium]
MWDKRQIHKKISMDAGDRILVEKSRVSCVFLSAVNELGRLLMVLVVALALTGCAEYSPWPKDTRSRPSIVNEADLATFNEAILLTESLRYEEASEKFRQAFDRFSIAGDRQRSAEALFWLGFCLEKQHRSAEAREIYVRLAEEYAETRAADQAVRRLSRLSGGGQGR